MRKSCIQCGRNVIDTILFCPACGCRDFRADQAHEPNVSSSDSPGRQATTPPSTAEQQYPIESATLSSVATTTPTALAAAPKPVASNPVSAERAQDPVSDSASVETKSQPAEVTPSPPYSPATATTRAATNETASDVALGAQFDATPAQPPQAKDLEPTSIQGQTHQTKAAAGSLLHMALLTVSVLLTPVAQIAAFYEVARIRELAAALNTELQPARLSFWNIDYVINLSSLDAVRWTVILFAAAFLCLMAAVYRLLGQRSSGRLLFSASALTLIVWSAGAASVVNAWSSSLPGISFLPLSNFPGCYTVAALSTLMLLSVIRRRR